jgi:hypothetical protein
MAVAVCLTIIISCGSQKVKENLTVSSVVLKNAQADILRLREMAASDEAIKIACSNPTFRKFLACLDTDASACGPTNEHKTLFAAERVPHLIDVRDAPPVARRVAPAVCLLVHPTSLHRAGKRWHLDTERSDFCEQDEAAFAQGTGFLIARNRIVTATHIGARATSLAAVLNFVVTDDEPRGRKDFDCEEVRMFLREVSRTKGVGRGDWVVYECEPFDVVPISQSSVAPVVGDTVFGLGYPSGLPMKYSGPARVVAADSTCPDFETNLALYDKESGAPVLSPAGVAVGVHKGGNYQLGDAKATYRPYSGCTRINEVLSPTKARYVRVFSNTEAIIDLLDFPSIDPDVQAIFPGQVIVLKTWCERKLHVLSCCGSDRGWQDWQIPTDCDSVSIEAVESGACLTVKVH